MGLYKKKQEINIYIELPVMLHLGIYSEEIIHSKIKAIWTGALIAMLFIANKISYKLYPMKRTKYSILHHID